MNFSDPEFWLKVLLVVWNAALTGAFWLRKPGQDAQQAVVALDRRLVEENAQFDRRLVVIEETIKHLPTGEEMAEVKNIVVRVESVCEGQNALLNALDMRSRRMEDFLLNQKR